MAAIPAFLGWNQSQMSIRTLSKLEEANFPPGWINLDYLPDSNAERIEIYLVDKDETLEELTLMFYDLFREIKNDLKIYNNSWWDFCLDTWDIIEDKHNYELDGKSSESKAYLFILTESEIEKGYEGICSCMNFDKFLSIILACILTHQAPYSPIFYDEKNEFFFYFHHTGSIGFYYRYKNPVVLKILTTAKEEYDI